MVKFTRKALFLGLALGAAGAFADTGGLRFKFVDSEGNPVVGAAINASTVDSLTTKSVTTDNNGEARIVGLDPSEKYEVKVSGQGYQAIRNAARWRRY